MENLLAPFGLQGSTLSWDLADKVQTMPEVLTGAVGRPIAFAQTLIEHVQQ